MGRHLSTYTMVGPTGFDAILKNTKSRVLARAARFGRSAANVPLAPLRRLLAQGFTQALPILAENMPLACSPGARIPCLASNPFGTSFINLQLVGPTGFDAILKNTKSRVLVRSAHCGRSAVNVPLRHVYDASPHVWLLIPYRHIKKRPRRGVFI